MHELSVCYDLLQQVERIAHEQGATAVSRIVLRIGPLSGIEVPLLRRAYPLAAAGTIAEHAELAIEASDVIVSCNSCSHQSTVSANRLLCNNCGDFRTKVISGDEMLLQRLELETAAQARQASI